MKRLSLAGLLAGALLLAACATRAPTDPLVNYRGGDMQDVIVLQRSTLETGAAGLPQARAVLVNKAGITQRFEYKFVWFDQSDMSIDDIDRPWKAASLAGHDEMTVSATAPGDKATRYQIHIRSPQE